MNLLRPSFLLTVLSLLSLSTHFTGHAATVRLPVPAAPVAPSRQTSPIQTRLDKATQAASALNFGQAYQELQQALKESPNNPTVLAQMILLLHQWQTNPYTTTHPNMATQQQAYIRLAASLFPNSPEVLAAFATVNAHNGDTETARSQFEQALSTTPNTLAALTGLATFYINTSDWQAAKDTVSYALEYFPNDANLLLLAGKMLNAQGDPHAASLFLSDSQQISPAFSAERTLLTAQLASEQKNYDAAITAYQAFLSHVPNHAPTLETLSEVYAQKGDLKNSQQFIIKAFQADKTLLNSREDVAKTILFKLSPADPTFEAAKKAWRKILNLPAGDYFPLIAARSDAAHWLAAIHYHTFLQGLSGDPFFNTDFQQIQALSENNPQDATLALDMAKLRIIGNPAALASLEPLTTIDSDLLAGEALFLLERYSEAEERLEAAEPMDTNYPNYALPYLDAGLRLYLDGELTASKTLFLRGQKQKALPEIDAAIRLVDGQIRQAEQLIAAGDALFNQKQYAAALVQYKEAQKHYRHWVAPYIRQGETYEKLKQKPQAFAAYKQAVQINPQMLSAKPFAKKYEKLKKASLSSKP